MGKPSRVEQATGLIKIVGEHWWKLIIVPGAVVLLLVWANQAMGGPLALWLKARSSPNQPTPQSQNNPSVNQSANTNQTVSNTPRTGSSDNSQQRATKNSGKKNSNDISVQGGAGQIQQNSGGINVQQGTTGPNSPIINSPININTGKRIPDSDMQKVRDFLASSPEKPEVDIWADQYSGASPFPSDFYTALKAAGWKMKNPGVTSMTVVDGSGSNGRVTIYQNGNPLRDHETLNATPPDSLYFILKILGDYGIKFGLERKTEYPSGTIAIEFRGRLQDR